MNSGKIKHFFNLRLSLWFFLVKRVKVIEEIFETEKKYIACLDTVDKVGIFMLLSGRIYDRKICHLILCMRAWDL